VLALPSIPEFVVLGPGPPLDLGLPVGPLLIVSRHGIPYLRRFSVK